LYELRIGTLAGGPVVTTTQAITVALVRAAAAFALSLSTAAPVAAADWSRAVISVPATYVGEFGMRFWFGQAQTKKGLFDTSGAMPVSRLDYHDLSIFTGEAFSRLDFNNGWFIKGYVGGGGLFGGKLKDEDFPPVVVPYSATLSDNKSGSVIYGSVDVGIKLVRGPDFHVGGFVGYHFLRDYVDALGCTQIASNTDICFPSIPDSIRGVSQTNTWLRLGFEAAVEFDQRWKVTLDAAWLPYAALYGADTHLLRIGANPGDFTGPVPDDGKGWGYQFDAIVSYRFSDWVSVGVGGRYWHVEAKGHSHFEGHVVDFNAQSQVVHWRADHFGAFIQANIKFGPYRVSSN
jgi:hypothetical protein